MKQSHVGLGGGNLGAYITYPVIGGIVGYVLLRGFGVFVGIPIGLAAAVLADI